MFFKVKHNIFLKKHHHSKETALNTLFYKKDNIPLKNILSVFI